MADWSGTIVITGGAGFIGSCMVRTLNDKGMNDIIIVDNIADTGKWLNLRNKSYREYVHKSKFLQKLKNEEFRDISGMIHMGACSSTVQTDFDYLWNNNIEYTKTLWDFCSKYEIPFLYASSAATYGDGAKGFDDRNDINQLRPLNGYGYSKQVFDQWTLWQKTRPPQHVGLKFFNVYGPNEYFKGSMASMAYHGFEQAKKHGVIRLFKSYHREYVDGGQMRDFIYVKDVCDVICYFMDHPQYSGIFNVGTGHAQSFVELAEAIFHAMLMEPQIEYFDMPEYLRHGYQYYTQADIHSLRTIGYMKTFRDVEQGVYDYVTGYLGKSYVVY